jgi:hypothetical protein
MSFETLSSDCRCRASATVKAALRRAVSHVHETRLLAETLGLAAASVSLPFDPHWLSRVIGQQGCRKDAVSHSAVI